MSWYCVASFTLLNAGSNIISKKRTQNDFIVGENDPLEAIVLKKFNPLHVYVGMMTSVKKN